MTRLFLNLLLAALSIFGLLVVSAMAGTVYQSIGAAGDRKRLAVHGRWIEIAPRRRLYALEKGRGSPSVVFEAGIAATHLNWARIQECVADFARTIAYDRAGLGWSGPIRSPRTPSNIVSELRSMLERANIPPPYLLVGHSFGGLVLRCFAALYPEEVAGLVLIDPMRCEEWPPLNPAKQAEIERGRRLLRFAIPAAKFGIVRFAVHSLFLRRAGLSGSLAAAAGDGGRYALSRITEEVGKMPRETWPTVAAHWSRPACFKGVRNYIEAVPLAVAEMCNAAPLGGIPVTVLTSGTSAPLTERQLDSIGDCVRQVVAPQSAHWIHLDEPQLVIDTIRRHAESAAHSKQPAGT